MNTVDQTSSRQIARLISRRSIATFLIATLLVGLSLVFMRFSFGFQNQMLEVASLTFDQRLQLNHARERVLFLLRTTDRNTPERLISKIQKDISMSLDALENRQKQLDAIHKKSTNGYAGYLGFDVVGTKNLNREIKQNLEQVATRLRRFTEASPMAIKVGNNYWNPEDLAIIRNDKQHIRLKALNDQIYESVTTRNNSLNQLHDVLLMFIFLCLVLVWVALLKPMITQLHKLFMELNKKNAAIEHQATHDALTGLKNRQAHNRLLEGKLMVNSTTAVAQPHAILAMDMDNFKGINDSFGHDIGDLVLTTIAERISENPLFGEMAFRLGGDEFLVAFGSGHDSHALKMRSEQIVALCAQAIPFGQRVLYPNVSAGLAIKDHNLKKVDELTKAADIALYRAKHQGGNRALLFNEISDRNVAESLQIEKEMYDGLENGEFIVYYQPVYCAITNQVISAEALCRWQHPERGLLSPAFWLPIANRVDLLSEISIQVLKQVGEDMGSLYAQGLRQIPIGVNTTRQLILSGRMLEALKECSLGLSNQFDQFFRVEIPESIVLAQNYSAILKKIEEIHRAGYSIAIDDFGTGYATLSHLVDFPFDILKIDKRFIQEITTQPNYTAVVKSVISLAKDLEKEIVCEGVENLATLTALRKLGGRLIQGNYYSPPVTWPKLLKQLKASSPRVQEEKTVSINN